MITQYKKATPSTFKLSREHLIFFGIALVASLLLSIPFFIGPNRGPFAAHAFHHSSFVSQIIGDIFPPENPGLGGTKIGYYWGFHALIAVLTSLTNTHQLQVVFIFNTLSLLAVFNIAYSFAKALDLPEQYCYILPLAIVGLMRPEAGLFIVYKFLSGKLIPVDAIVTHNIALLPSDVLSSWIGELPWLDTRLFYVNKLYNVSAMPLAISLCFSYLLILFRNKFRSNKIYLVSLCFVIIACILNYPPLAIFSILHAPIWAVVVFLSRQGHFKEKFHDTSRVLLPYIIAVLSVTPYLIFVIAGRDISSSSQGEIVSLDFYAQSVRNIVVFLIPFLGIVIGIWFAYRKSSLRDFYFLLIGTALCLGLTTLTRWSFDNSYKFNYILVFFFSIFFVISIYRLLYQNTNRWITRFIYSGVILLLLITPLTIEIAYIVSCLSQDRFFSFSKGHIIYSKDEAKNDAYAWIRENTPTNSLIMMSYFETRVPYEGLNPNYEVAAISERSLYVIKDTDYTTSNPEYAKRVKLREKLFKNPDDPQVIDFFRSLNRPVYLLVEENLRDVFLVEDRFKHFPENPGEPFELKFRNNKQRVYHIHFNK
ncbi:MAG: hypothetical protein HZC48_07585 [Nitrospirae bacterium]|nr:hypothetical protein [Nitrospirota bacterium]